MNRRVRDLTGQRFGSLVAVRALGVNAHRQMMWECRCDCGATTESKGSGLIAGGTVNCGCKRREKLIAQTRIHGHTAVRRSPTYQSWSGMMARCNRPTTKGWAAYGARGIRVCERWLSFENFLADMGERPLGMTLDRLDNALGYEPSNCRWATRAQQDANRRPTNHQGKQQCRTASI